MNLKGKTVFLFCFLTGILFHSCDQSPKIKASALERFRMLTEKAEKLLKTNADSAVLYADSAIYLTNELSLPGGSRYAPYQIKSLALLKKGLTDSAIVEMEHGRNLFFMVYDSLSMARASGFLALQEMNRGRHFMAEKYFLDALDLFTNLKLEHDLSQVLQKYGILLTRRGENKKSQHYLLKALQIAQDADSLNEVAMISVNIGNNYADMGQTAEALNCYQTAWNAAVKASSPENQMKSLINTGILYRKSDPGQALSYYNRALEIEKKHPDKRLFINIMYNIALLYHDRQDLPKAVENYRIVLNFCTSEKLFPGQIRALRGLSEAYGEKGELSEAIRYMEQALALSDLTGETSSSPYYMQKLAAFYEKSGNYLRANQLIKKVLFQKDSIQRRDKIAAFEELETLNQIRHKELEYDRISKAMEAQKAKQRFRIIMIIILGISTVILGWSLFRSYRLLQHREQAYAVLMEKYQKEIKRAKMLPEEIRDVTATIPGLPVSQNDPLIFDLMKYYQEEQPYLDPKLKLATVTARLSTSEKALAASLKNIGDYNFNSFTNMFRVETAKKLMAEQKYREYTIEAIAEESGFGSRMSFYHAFAQFTGVRPSYFRRYLKTRVEENSE